MKAGAKLTRERNERRLRQAENGSGEGSPPLRKLGELQKYRGGQGNRISEENNKTKQKSANNNKEVFRSDILKGVFICTTITNKRVLNKSK